MGVIIPRVVTESSASGAQVIGGSLRFDRTFGHHLAYTPSSAGNRKTWTWSAWVKRDAKDDATHQTFFSAGDSSVRTNFMFDNTGYTNPGTIQINYQAGQGSGPYSTKSRRDHSAFYHIVVAFDTTQGTAANRIKCWVNGVEDVLGTNSFPSQNTDWAVNNTQLHTIGRNCELSEPFGGRYSNFYLIDGQALAPTDFGYTDSLTGTWRPKKYEGTYGTNGFYLPFDGNSPAGEDQSGNGNDWTPIDFGGSTVIPKATGALPILNTINGGKVASPGARGQAGVAVTVYNSGSGNKYYLDGQEAATVKFVPGQTVTFDTSDSTVSSHPFRFSTTSNGSHGGGSEYTSGVAAITGAATTITIPNTAPSNLYYYCTTHSGMGGAISIGASNPVVADPAAWKCVFALSGIGAGDIWDISPEVNCTTDTLLGLQSNAAQTLPSYDVSQFYGVSSYYRGPIGNGYDYWYYNLTQSKLAFGSNDFTIEMWFLCLDLTAFKHMPLIVKGAVGANNQFDWRLYISSTNTSIEPIYFDVDGGPSLETPASFKLREDRWYHVAICKDATNVRMYVDGIQRDTASWSGGPVDDDYQQFSTGYNNIGASGDSYFCGHLQDIRCYNGVAKYTSNFIPASTHPDILPETPSGVALSSNLTKVTAGAVTFDGANDRLDIVDSSDFDCGTNDFTFECFVYKVTTGKMAIFETRTYGGDGFNLEFNTADKFEWYDPSLGANLPGDSTAIALRTWTHYAVVRNGASCKMYRDGREVGTAKDVGSNSQVSAGTPRIGEAANNTNDFKGLISNVRFIKGTALYTANFTPPSAPLTNITNTKLLCCQSPTSAVAIAVGPSSPNNGTTWSTRSYWTGTSGDGTLTNASSYPLTAAFDGDLGTTFGMSYAGGMIWTPPSPISFSSSVEVYIDNAIGVGIQGYVATISGTQESQVDLTLSDSWGTIKSGSGTLDKLQIVRGTGSGNNNLWVTALRVDGIILIDGATAITVSGNASATTFNPFDNGINAVMGQESGYCTLNPLALNSNYTLTNGNLVSSGYAGASSVYGTMAMPSSGKWYFECIAQSDIIPGICLASAAHPDNYPGQIAESYGFDCTNASFYNNAPVNGAVSSVLTAAIGDIIGVCYDADNGTLKFTIDNLSASGSSNAFSSIPSGDYLPAFRNGSSVGVSANFGQKPFKFTPPEGFNAICNANLQSPVLTRPDQQYFKSVLYAGDNETTHPIITGFRPDLAIVKARGTAEKSIWCDSVRGAGSLIYSSNTDAQETGGAYYNQWPSIDNNGFTVGGTNNGINNDSHTYVAYAWKAGGGGGAQGNSGTFSVDDVSYASASAAGLTAGDTVPTAASVGTKQGFSIIRYTGPNNTSNHEVPHGLSQAPNFIVTKNLDATFNWDIYHSSLADDKYLIFTNAEQRSSGFNGRPTSTVFKTEHDYSTNENQSYIAYCWHDVLGLQKFGYYKGTGSATTGLFVFTGFRPALIIVKGADEDKNWTVWDKNVNPINPTSQYLVWPSNSAGEASGMVIDILSNGFKIRSADSQINNGGKTYVYMAWADQPVHNLYGGQANAR